MPKKTEIGKNVHWRAAEYEHFERGPIWYAVVGVIALALVVFALATGNFFFGVFVILALVMLVSFGRFKPRIIDFRLTEDGVGIGPKIFYNFNVLDGFAVNNRPGRLDEIILRKKSTFNPYVRIPVDSKTAVEAKEFLSGKLPEIAYKESLIDIFADWFRF